MFFLHGYVVFWDRCEDFGYLKWTDPNLLIFGSSQFLTFPSTKVAGFGCETPCLGFVLDSFVPKLLLGLLCFRCFSSQNLRIRFIDESWNSWTSAKL